MNRSKNRRGVVRVLGVMLALLPVAAACGSDDDDDASSSETTVSVEESATTVGETATTAGDTATTAGDTATTAGDTATTMAEVPQGGTLRVANAFDAQFDPDRFDFAQFAYGKLLYDPLIEFDLETREPMPWLATEWEMAADNMSITITLRDDVVYHSGTPFTAESVIPTIEKKKDPATGFSFIGLLVRLQSWEAVDEHTLKLGFDQPLREELVMEWLEMIRPFDPASIPNIATAPSGTGPFMFVSTEAGKQTVLKKNPNYWREGEPVLDEVVFTKFNDRDSATAALEAGEVDVMWPATAADAGRLAEDGYKVEQQYATGTYNLVMNATKPPFDNKKFRQAMLYVFDRELIAESIWHGLSMPLALPWSVPPGYSEEVNEQYSFDLDKARALVEESGLSEQERSFPVMITSDQTEGVLMAQQLQSNLAQIGVEITIDPVDIATLIERRTSYPADYVAVLSQLGFANRFPSMISTADYLRASETNAIWGPNVPQAYLDALKRVNDPSVDLETAVEEFRTFYLDEAWASHVGSAPTRISIASEDVGYENINDDQGFLVLRNAYLQQ